jgi:hypothetical protein
MDDRYLRQFARNPKTLLEKHSWHSLKIKSMQLQLAEQMESLTISDLTPDTKKTIEYLNTKLINEIEHLIMIRKVSTEAIEELMTDERLKVVLRLRYINYFSWELIADKMYYTKRWITVLHNRAVSMLSRRAAQKLKEYGKEV